MISFSSSSLIYFCTNSVLLYLSSNGSLILKGIGRGVLQPPPLQFFALKPKIKEVEKVSKKKFGLRTKLKCVQNIK